MHGGIVVKQKSHAIAQVIDFEQEIGRIELLAGPEERWRFEEAHSRARPPVDLSPTFNSAYKAVEKQAVRRFVCGLGGPGRWQELAFACSIFPWYAKTDYMATTADNEIARGRQPVFVIGCHRSGTNLLYDTLLSAGGFAVYRGFLPIYKILIPRFGSLHNRKNREKIAEVWLRSKGFRRSGLDAGALTQKILADCRTGGDFIRITMDEIARNQGVARWAVYDPDNVNHIMRVKRDIPGALFVHIIRDGRDIALSLKTMGGFTPLPWDRGDRSLLATAAYWRWMVRRGKKNGRIASKDYIEIRYEDLVGSPRQTLARLGDFLDHDLDYDRIQETGLGRLRESNSSFRGMAGEEQVSPVQRWKQRLRPEEVAGIEALAGDCLTENGYELVTPESERRTASRARWMRLLYDGFLSGKFWLKIETPVGRLANMEALELADPVSAKEAAPERP